MYVYDYVKKKKEKIIRIKFICKIVLSVGTGALKDKLPKKIVRFANR